MTDTQHARRIRKHIAELHAALDDAVKDGISFWATLDEDGNSGRAPRNPRRAT